MSNLVEHARRELELIGEDPVYSASLVAAVAAFGSFGHSGASAEMARAQLHALLGFEALSPLSSDPAEWCDVAEVSGIPLWQNRRNPAAFSEDCGKTYHLVSEPRGDDGEFRRYTAATPREGANA